MITAYFRGKNSGRHLEYETVEALTEALERALKAGDQEVVLRFPDDDSFYATLTWRNKQQEEAVRACQILTGAEASAWAQQFLAAEGAGWRVLWAPAKLKANQPQMPMNGMRMR